MVVTWEEALAEREATGAVREVRKAILLLAERRQRLTPEEFGELAAKLETIDDLDRLHRILEAIFEVRSLAELGLD